MKQLIIWVSNIVLACAITVASADEYHLATGDVVSVSVYGHPDLLVDAVQVDGQHNITIPLLGNVNVDGLSTRAAAEKIERQLESSGYIIKPHVNVFVQQYLGKQIAVLGQVNLPGKYALMTSSHVSDILALAGGINVSGSDSIILIHKQNGVLTQTTINTLALFKDNQLNLDDMVHGGDIVYVPRAEVFYIYGEVQRPGAYRLEKNMNVMQAIALGGGITPLGTERSPQIRRQGKDGQVTLIHADKEQILQPNDVLYIKQSLF